MRVSLLTSTLASTISSLIALMSLSSLGCSAGKTTGDDSFDDPDTSGSTDDVSGFDLGSPFTDVSGRDGTPCTGIACQQVDCPGGGSTTVSGTVYAPNGKLPLYNVIVYVPNGELSPLKAGAQCDKCGSIASGSPIVTALTDYKGNFTLSNVPVGSNIPLVIQLGKWRRKVSIPTVTACTDTKLTDHNLTRLPKNQSEGDMPRIAVTTGGCDRLSCMLPKVGIDASEFGVKGSKAAVHFYSAGGASGPAGMTDAKPFWSSTAELMKYDIAIFSCECYEAPSTKDATSYKAVTDYLAAGGRIFTTDFQYTWYKYSPDPGLKAIGNIPGGAPTGESPMIIDKSFPKGKALADWMGYVDPTASGGTVKPDYVFDNIYTINKASVQQWMYSGPPHPRVITVNTPVGKPVEDQCGKAVHLDAHINQTDNVDTTYPAGCKSPILQGEEAFAFFFFDLASCIQKEDAPPKVPPVR